ncbi:hypothetical protein D3C71_1255710 [compost metagenome]
MIRRPDKGRGGAGQIRFKNPVAQRAAAVRHIVEEVLVFIGQHAAPTQLAVFRQRATHVQIRTLIGPTAYLGLRDNLQFRGGFLAYQVDRAARFVGAAKQAVSTAQYFDVVIERHVIVRTERAVHRRPTIHAHIADGESARQVVAAEHRPLEHRDARRGAHHVVQADQTPVFDLLPGDHRHALRHLAQRLRRLAPHRGRTGGERTRVFGHAHAAQHGDGLKLSHAGRRHANQAIPVTLGQRLQTRAAQQRHQPFPDAHHPVHARTLQTRRDGGIACDQHPGLSAEAQQGGIQASRVNAIGATLIVGCRLRPSRRRQMGKDCAKQYRRKKGVAGGSGEGHDSEFLDWDGKQIRRCVGAVLYLFRSNAEFPPFL